MRKIILRVMSENIKCNKNIINKSHNILNMATE